MQKFFLFFVFTFHLFTNPPQYAIRHCPRYQGELNYKVITDKISDVLHFIKPYLPPNPVVLECGGHDGEDTVFMASFWPQGKVYTFEPVPELFKILTYKTVHFPNIKRYQLALSEVTGTQTFYFSDLKNSGSPSGSSSLLPPKDHLKFDSYVTFNGTFEVASMKLDDWAKIEGLDQIDFMWLDMQGYELNMLKISELAKKTKVIYLEVEFIEAYKGQYLYSNVKKWMEENGFKLLALDFNEELALLGDSFIKPGSGFRYFGNAVFLNERLN
jgi:2-O-methyltransferase